MAKRTTKEFDGVVTPIERTIVQTIDPGLSKRLDDNERIKRLNAEFRRKISKEPKISYKPPKFYADILGKIYAYTFNNYDVIVRFDGTEQKFPETVYKHLMKKLARILDSSTPVNEIVEL
jgi:hypothetical protein